MRELGLKSPQTARIRLANSFTQVSLETYLFLIRQLSLSIESKSKQMFSVKRKKPCDEQQQFKN